MVEILGDLSCLLGLGGNALPHPLVAEPLVEEEELILLVALPFHHPFEEVLFGWAHDVSHVSDAGLVILRPSPERFESFGRDVPSFFALWLWVGSFGILARLTGCVASLVDALPLDEVFTLPPFAAVVLTEPEARLN